MQNVSKKSPSQKILTGVKMTKAKVLQKSNDLNLTLEVISKRWGQKIMFDLSFNFPGQKHWVSFQKIDLTLKWPRSRLNPRSPLHCTSEIPQLLLWSFFPISDFFQIEEWSEICSSYFAIFMYQTSPRERYTIFWIQNRNPIRPYFCHKKLSHLQSASL